MAFPKKSEALHKLHGTTPAGSAKVTESYVKAGRPKFPKGITPEQKATFKRIVALLEQRRTVTPADAELIYLYSVLEEQWQLALAEIRRDGVICTYERTDNSGKLFTTRKKNEACAVASDCQRQMFAILRELGLSPKSRDAVKPTGNSATAIVPGSMAALFGANLENLNSEPKPRLVAAPEQFEEEEDETPADR